VASMVEAAFTAVAVATAAAIGNTDPGTSSQF